MGSRKQGFETIFKTAGNNLVSTFADYSNNRSLLLFRCCDCGTEFKTTSFLYQKSQDGKRCFECRKRLSVSDERARDTFIKRCREIHGNYYEYSLVPDTFTSKQEITIICPKHGHIKTTPDQHKNKGSGCQRCHIDNITSKTRRKETDFIFQANNIHNFYYLYEKVNYVNARTPVIISCPKHGNFTQTPDVHLRGSGCPQCSSTILTTPIKKIISMLNNNEIVHSLEKTFNGCVGETGRHLRYDIFIPEKNLCVEFDGPHHFFPMKYSSTTTDEQAKERFEIQQTNDSIKDVFCEQNNINLVRIPYTDHHPDATLLQLLMTMENQRFIYSWSDLDDDIKKIVAYIKSFQYDKFAVYGISRGGLCFAVPISNHFEYSEFGIIQYQRYDGNDKKAAIQLQHKTLDCPIFLIDDLISSGETMERCKSKLSSCFKQTPIVHPVVIFGEDNDNDIFFIREHPKQWIVFPYEV